MRSKKSIISFVVQNFRMVAGILVSFIAAPLLLKYVGEERFGAYRVLFDIFSYFGIVDIGIFGSMMLVLNKAMVKEDTTDKWAAIIASKRIYYKITAITVLIFLSFIPFLDYFVPTKDIPYSELLISYFVMGVGIFFLTLKVNQAYLEARQMSYIIGFGLTFQNLCYSAIAIFLGYLGYGLVGMTIGFALGQLLPYFYYLYKFHKIVKSPSREVLDSDVEAKTKEIWHIQWPVLLTSIAGRLSIYSDTIIISKIMSPVAVSAFFISQRVIGIAGNFLMGISGSTWAAMGELYNSGERDKFEDLFIRISKFIAVTSAIVGIPLVLMSKTFVTLWVGESLFVSNIFILVAVLNLLIQSILTFWGWCFTVTHKVHKLVKLQIVSTIVNISASIYFTYQYDHVGPILGTLFGYITVFVWWMIWHLKEEFNLSVMKLLKTFVPSLIYLLLLSFLGLRYSNYFQSTSWVNFILTSLILGGANTLVCIFTLFSTSERAFFLERIVRIVKR